MLVAVFIIKLVIIADICASVVRLSAIGRWPDTVHAGWDRV